MEKIGSSSPAFVRLWSLIGHSRLCCSMGTSAPFHGRRITDRLRSTRRGRHLHVDMPLMNALLNGAGFCWLTGEAAPEAFSEEPHRMAAS
jgi:hypothetical protein